MAASGKGPPHTDGDVGVGATPRAGATDAAAPVDAAGGVEGTDGVSRVEGVRAPEVPAIGAARAAAAVDEIAAALRAGHITIAEAVDRLIDDAVQRHVGRAVEQGGEVEARLRRVLRDYAEADPLISAKIRRLDARRGGR
jgi:hypothetical protein